MMLPVAGLLAAMLAAQTAAPTQPPNPPASVPLQPRVGVDVAAPQSLSLDEAIRLTLEHNNDVAIARLATESARLVTRAAQGIFDPVVVPALSYQKATTATASAIGGASNGVLDSNNVFGTVDLSGRSPWAGGRYAVDFASTRNETSNQLARLNPQFPTSLAVSYVQPLFRGRTIDFERRQILIARRGEELTDAQLRQVVIEQLTLVEEAYWDLSFAVQNLDVQVTALGQAQTQVESNERQAQQGTLAPIDVVEAQTQVANFRQTVAQAQQVLTESENRLKALILSDRNATMWAQPLLPTDPVDRGAPDLSLEEAMTMALRQRPELAALEANRAQNEVDRQFFADQTRPQVNLLGTYTLSGLAGGTVASAANPLGTSSSETVIRERLNELLVLSGLTTIDPPPVTTVTVPDFFVGGYQQSLENLFARRFPTALVQLQVALPIGNTTARANLARTGIVATQFERQRQRLEQVIEAQVRDSLQAVRTSEERLDAASAARRNAQEQYESERRRFESGLSTVFLVLERQTSLVTARARELRTASDLNQAVALLDRAVGSTLTRHGVAMQPPVQ